MIPKHKYLTLDAIRGVAAIFVSFLHLPSEYLLGIEFPHAYLAVDLFFSMSGFVLASAYDKDLLSGKLTANQFLKLRIIRVYPLYFVALLLWAALMIYDLVFVGRMSISLPILAAQIIFGLLFLPSPFPATFLFPLNGPAWSLFFELVINYFYGRFRAVQTIQKLWIIIFASGIALVFFTLLKGELSFGFTWHGAIGGLARVFYSFSAGLLIHHYRKIINRDIVSSNFASLIVLLLVGILLGMPSTKFHSYYDITIVIIIFPLVILTASFIQPKQALGVTFSKLGVASYGFYVLQYAFIWLYGNLFRNSIENLGFPPVTNLIFLLSLLFISSLILDRVFDEPSRRWIRGKIFGYSQIAIGRV